MMHKTALKTIFVVSIIGVIFSGYLSYTELFCNSCALGACSQQIASLPVCLYGFAAFVIILLISFLGLRSKK